MRQVDIFITASIRGPARGTGRVMYIMRTKRNSGADYESKFSVVESDNATEGRLVLLAIRDSLQRLQYACSVTIHTESTYIANAINNRWMEAWERSSWKNAKGKEVRDSVLWSQIFQMLEETGNELSAECGSHEFAHLMRWMMPLVKTYKDIFSDVAEDWVYSVNDRVR